MKDDSNIHGSLGPKLGEKVDPSSDIRPLTSLQYGPNGANGRTEHGIPLVTLCAELSAASEFFGQKTSADANISTNHMVIAFQLHAQFDY